MLPLLLVIIVLGIIIEAVSLRRDPDKVELDHSMSAQSCEPGAPFSVQTVITNKSRIPLLYLAINEVYPLAAQLPEGMISRTKYGDSHIKHICSVNGRRRKRLALETTINKRGVYSFRTESAEFGDFLGFREISKSVSLQNEIVIYPERHDYPDLTDALGRYCGDVASRRFLIRDPILTVGCREYTGREPMRDIHWLQSAHKGELMVREFDYTRQLSACVLLGIDGAGLPDDDELDKCCAVARSVCETLVERGVAVDFFTNALLKRRSGREVWRSKAAPGHTGGLLEGLGRVSSYACCSLERLLEYALRESEFDAAFILILPAGEKRSGELVNRMRNNTNQEVLLIQTNMPTG